MDEELEREIQSEGERESKEQAGGKWSPGLRNRR